MLCNQSYLLLSFICIVTSHSIHKLNKISNKKKIYKIVMGLDNVITELNRKELLFMLMIHWKCCTFICDAKITSEIQSKPRLFFILNTPFSSLNAEVGLRASASEVLTQFHWNSSLIFLMIKLHYRKLGQKLALKHFSLINLFVLFLPKMIENKHV